MITGPLPVMPIAGPTEPSRTLLGLSTCLRDNTVFMRSSLESDKAKPQTARIAAVSGD